LLNASYLLEYRTGILFKPIEFIKATPSADLAEANEDTAHGLKIKSLVTAED
jgi:hypothetical protein